MQNTLACSSPLQQCITGQALCAGTAISQIQAGRATHTSVPHESLKLLLLLVGSPWQVGTPCRENSCVHMCLCRLEAQALQVLTSRGVAISRLERVAAQVRLATTSLQARQCRAPAGKARLACLQPPSRHSPCGVQASCVQGGKIKQDAWGKGYGGVGCI